VKLETTFEEDSLMISISFFHFQALPKVPVPPLDQTMAEYLRALQPITTSQQFQRAEKLVKEFSIQPGPKLFDYLVAKRDEEDNWVSRERFKKHKSSQLFHVFRIIGYIIIFVSTHF